MSIVGKTIEEFRSKLRTSANDLQRKYDNNFPFNNRNTASRGIAYIELFCIWWMISTDPERFRNMMVPIHIDNKNNHSWLTKDTAPVAYLSILHPLYTLMREHNIRLFPVWVSSKSNDLADLASRGELDELRAKLPAWREHAAGFVKRVPLPSHAKPGPL